MGMLDKVVLGAGLVAASGCDFTKERDVLTVYQDAGVLDGGVPTDAFSGEFNPDTCVRNMCGDTGTDAWSKIDSGWKPVGDAGERDAVPADGDLPVDGDGAVKIDAAKVDDGGVHVDEDGATADAAPAPDFRLDSGSVQDSAPLADVDVPEPDVWLPVEPEVACFNHRDDNGDGTIDCADPTCRDQVGLVLGISPANSTVYWEAPLEPLLVPEDNFPVSFTCEQVLGRISFVLNTPAGNIRVRSQGGNLGKWGWNNGQNAVPGQLPDGGRAENHPGNSEYLGGLTAEGHPEVRVLFTAPYNEQAPDPRP